MIDLNHIFLFLAFISPLAVLARSWRPGSGYHGWRIAAMIVLAVTAVAWIFFHKQAGYIGAGAWAVLLFIPAIGLKRMTELSLRHRYGSARRLAVALQWLHPSSELRHQAQLFRLLETRQAEGVAPPPVGSGTGSASRLPTPTAPAVVAFIVLNAIAFLIEIAAGGWAAPNVLHRLGALEPAGVIYGGEYWRLLTALFLHAGAVHLLFNLFALYVLGPPLERSIGTARFSICYLISGLASSAGVVLLWKFGLTRTGELVGASGCVMGIVGAWAGFLVLHRHIPSAKRRLNNILMIVVIQFVFDVSTPQVSMAAHLCGLVAGFVLGLLLGPQADRPPPRQAS